jgi:hypothetical protein
MHIVTSMTSDYRNLGERKTTEILKSILLQIWLKGNNRMLARFTQASGDANDGDEREDVDERDSQGGCYTPLLAGANRSRLGAFL